MECEAQGLGFLMQGKPRAGKWEIRSEQRNLAGERFQDKEARLAEQAPGGKAHIRRCRTDLPGQLVYGSPLIVQETEAPREGLGLCGSGTKGPGHRFPTCCPSTVFSVSGLSTAKSEDLGQGQECEQEGQQHQNEGAPSRDASMTPRLMLVSGGPEFCSCPQGVILRAKLPGSEFIRQGLPGLGQSRPPLCPAPPFLFSLRLNLLLATG